MKRGDIVRVKNTEGLNPLQFKVDKIKDGPTGKLVSGEFGEFAIELLEVVESRPKDLKELSLTETVERLAAVNYSYDQMAIYVGMKKSAFRKEATTEDSPIWTAIQKGRLVTQFEIDDKLSQNAMSGNITAAQMYKKSAEEKRLENIKSQIFYVE